jgi:hypothetical protein
MGSMLGAAKRRSTAHSWRVDNTVTSMSHLEVHACFWNFFRTELTMYDGCTGVWRMCTAAASIWTSAWELQLWAMRNFGSGNYSCIVASSSHNVHWSVEIWLMYKFQWRMKTKGKRRSGRAAKYIPSLPVDRSRQVWMEVLNRSRDFHGVVPRPRSIKAAVIHIWINLFAASVCMWNWQLRLHRRTLYLSYSALLAHGSSSLKLMY